MSLFRETRGFEWKSKANWGTGLPCNQTWFGVSCDPNGNVISLSLPGNRLIGTIPSSLSGACALKTIQLHDNCTMLSNSWCLATVIDWSDSIGLGLGIGSIQLSEERFLRHWQVSSLNR